MWYGLTKEEALARCEGLGLEYSFVMTTDPKRRALPEGPEDGEAIPKVIRAREEGGAMVFLLGLFAPAKGVGDTFG